jgi:hypothetical protein
MREEMNEGAAVGDVRQWARISRAPRKQRERLADDWEVPALQRAMEQDVCWCERARIVNVV